MVDSTNVEVIWPDGTITIEKIGSDWLEVASNTNFEIPLGCLKGTCGACEIEVNGRIVRACISKVALIKSSKLKISIPCDPYW